MAENHSPQIPWASLAVAVTFVSGTLLVPQAFDLLRPPEKDRAQALVGAELEVDARLWEDPFTAVRRHEAERTQRCEKARDAKPPSRECDAIALAARRGPGSLHQRLDADRDGDIEEALVLAVMVPGNPFVGAEESRRRTRYAVLSGLQAERYLPDNAEHVGLMRIDVPSLQAGAPSTAIDSLLLPYELLSDRRYIGVGARPESAASAAPAASAATDTRPARRAVALLWVDESALPSPKLDALAYTLQAAIGACAPSCPKLALIGPSSSEGLRTALTRLARLAKYPSDAAALSAPVRAGYRLIANAQVFDASATIADADLEVLLRDDVQGFVRDRLQRILKDPAPPPVTFERSMASDDRVMQALADELRQRLPGDPKRRIVTITESDSIYARSLERRLRRLSAPFAAPRRPEDTVYFFRGVDGVTVREASDRTTVSKKPDAPAAIEWPESRDQLDYLRRMVAELKRSESVRPEGNDAPPGKIGAIGIFANDVHDKLLTLQALHDSFPDTVFFTTDMDARYLHPRTLPFTRNLVVASSLPLQFPSAPASSGTPASAAASQRQLHAGTPPFRDVYQASTYLAARLASCLRRCEGIAAQARAAIAAPSVYEIGRDRAVPLAGLDLHERRAAEPTASYWVGLWGGVLALVAGLVVWPSTPSLRHARTWLLQGPAPATRRLRDWAPTVAFTAAYAALLALTVASVVEALMPGRLGVSGTLTWALLGALAALLVAPAWYRIAGVAAEPAPGPSPWPRRLLQIAVLAALGWLAWQRLLPEEAHSGEPMAWLQGISGWPSHLINLLALLAGVVALDVVGTLVREARDADDRWLALPADAAADARAVPMRRRADALTQAGREALVGWIRTRTLLGWRVAAGSSVDFATLWREYLVRSTAVPRLMRVAFWYVLAVVTISLLFIALSDYRVPDVPVRGASHRHLISGVLATALLLLPLVVVAVADATMLAWRFITLLNRGRTVYPPQTVARFAAELGPQHLALWCQPVAAEPADRLSAPRTAAPAHSLLDDWIDIQVIARRTRVVAALVVAPFIMLALMVLARSRLFDNWALTWPIATSAALYVLWLGVLALLLKQAAEAARTAALARMNADLRWLLGAEGDLKNLAEPMKRLIAAVEAQRTGAFAPTLDQWFFKGLLVPLGGAGGAQLLEGLLMVR